MPQEAIEAGHFSPDILAFILLLDKHEVRYVIVGGEAVIFHGYARLTGDVDFFHDPTADNARALFAALDAFWVGNVPGLAGRRELIEEGAVVQFGRPPNRIDLLSRIDAVTFSEAWATRRAVTMISPAGERTVPPYYLSLANLIRNNAAAARPKDLDDLQYLRRAADPID
jgi:hypothetical protein